MFLRSWPIHTITDFHAKRDSMHKSVRNPRTMTQATAYSNNCQHYFFEIKTLHCFIQITRNILITHLKSARSAKSFLLNTIFLHTQASENGACGRFCFVNTTFLHANHERDLNQTPKTPRRVRVIFWFNATLLRTNPKQYLNQAVTKTSVVPGVVLLNTTFMPANQKKYLNQATKMGA